MEAHNLPDTLEQATIRKQFPWDQAAGYRLLPLVAGRFAAFFGAAFLDAAFLPTTFLAAAFLTAAFLTATLLMGAFFFGAALVRRAGSLTLALLTDFAAFFTGLLAARFAGLGSAGSGAISGPGAAEGATNLGR